MNKAKIALLGSGKGSTINALCEAVKHNILNLDISLILTNRAGDQSIKNIADTHGIEYINQGWVKEYDNRDEYENLLSDTIKKYNPDLIVLAGWNFVFSKNFISKFKRIINLHPALPNQFTGQNCIKKAYNAFLKGEIKYTGSMVHEVVPEVDRGNVLTSIRVPIFETDSYEDLEKRVKDSEKGILIQAIQYFINLFNENYINEINSKVYTGKVRRVEDLGNGLLLLSASDRLSAFDRHICDITDKGSMLNAMSTWWFKNTKHIISNHYIYSDREHMIVKKTKPILIEMVVRAYMTGSSETSIWSMYKKGDRVLYGETFRDGYKKNEKLDRVVLTPTTKGVKDVPITGVEIVQQGYATSEDYSFMCYSALKLFEYGQYIAEQNGFILVDTKYEFGKLDNGKIILIDEVHTCDSSRYWLSSSYEDRFREGLEPEKLDKDCVRDWIKSQCDPYKDNIPVVPEEVKDKVRDVYSTYTKRITNNAVDYTNKSESPISRDEFVNGYFGNVHNQIVVILAGSVSDSEHVSKIQKYLSNYNIFSLKHFSSAHKNTREVLKILDKYENQSRKIVYVTVAGRSNALSGVTACNTRYPVIACPPFKDKDDMMVNINSTLQCPSKVPVMTILEPENVAFSIRKIFDM